ncbi:MAG TPA: DUF1810 domain-containing protein [Oxalobacteraceae bacterium]|nr:DUF1810 domain-containing protein [Oxalobacteraceae bacterium]
MNDPYNLQRFVLAQNAVYADVLAELGAGRKQSHWMWFIFPQLAGLGLSEMARKYAIGSLDEAKAYLQHPLLGNRLRECCRLVAETAGRSVEEIFGYPDDMKFHSSMTLFAQAAEDSRVFDECLRKYFSGKPDALTMAQLAR